MPENRPRRGNVTSFKPGRSGNPGGRPKANLELRNKCREMTPELLERLNVLSKTADTDSASVAAIKLLLAYGYGAPESKPLPDDDEVQTSAPVPPAKALAVLLRLKKDDEPPTDDSDD